MILNKSVLQKHILNMRQMELVPQSWSCDINKINLHIGRIGLITIPCIKAPVQNDVVSGGLYNCPKWDAMALWLKTIDEQPIAITITEEGLQIDSQTIKAKTF